MADGLSLSGRKLANQNGAVQGDLEISGNLILPNGGRIRDASGADYGPTSRSFSSNELFTAGARIATDGLPRITLPDAATTSVFAGPVGLQASQLAYGLTVGFDVTNDHSAGGNVRWRVILRKFNSFGTRAAPTIALDNTQTIAAPAAGAMGTVLHASWQNIDVTPDPFGSLYCAEIQRIGADGADTVLGPIGLTEVAFIRP